MNLAGSSGCFFFFVVGYDFYFIFFFSLGNLSDWFRGLERRTRRSIDWRKKYRGGLFNRSRGALNELNRSGEEPFIYLFLLDSSPSFRAYNICMNDGGFGWQLYGEIKIQERLKMCGVTKFRTMVNTESPSQNKRFIVVGIRHVLYPFATW
ncbi:hypothetical protein F5X99DRAFT_74098 [Biscogniauxia marginata]|nr:hypothetical protein F5X99DRAFT_74098 [Biscogniauxia marginata]